MPNGIIKQATHIRASNNGTGTFQEFSIYKE